MSLHRTRSRNRRRATRALLLLRDRALTGLRARFAGVPRDAGMATAEYAIVLVAAVSFAGLLVVILSSGEVREMLMSLVRGALSV